MPRKQHLYHFIYKTTCRLNGKFYVGMHSTSNLEDGYIGSGKRLGDAIRKHGRENFTFEILEWFSDRHSLKERERELIDEGMLNDPLCMNLAFGGEGGFINVESAIAGGKSLKGIEKSEIHKHNISNSNKGQVPWNKGKKGIQKHSEEVKHKMSEKHLGKKMSEESKQKNREAQIERWKKIRMKMEPIANEN